MPCYHNTNAYTRTQRTALHHRAHTRTESLPGFLVILALRERYRRELVCEACTDQQSSRHTCVLYLGSMMIAVALRKR